MEELPGRKPDWLDESKSFSLKTCTVRSIVFQESYCRSEAKRQVGSFWRTVYHFFVWIRTVLAFFPFPGKFHLTKTQLKNNR